MQNNRTCSKHKLHNNTVLVQKNSKSYVIFWYWLQFFNCVIIQMYTDHRPRFSYGLQSASSPKFPTPAQPSTHQSTAKKVYAMCIMYVYNASKNKCIINMITRNAWP